VKKGLKSVYIYRSYYKNKLGGPFFLEHPVHTAVQNSTRLKYPVHKTEAEKYGDQHSNIHLQR